MSAPLRPWELNGLLNRQNLGAVNNFGLWPPEAGRAPRYATRLIPQNIGQQQPGVATSPAQGGGPPPVPPRPDQQVAAGNVYNRYGTGYGMGAQNYMSYSPYSYSSPYSMMNSYGGGYGYGNRMPYGSDPYAINAEGTFFRMAEESSRQAFQSIESIVQAFASVSMMMESTYHAVYSSFRAVIGVADHFSRLRSHLAQVLSTLALVRTLHWLYRKALYLLGLSLSNPNSDQAWSAAARATAEALKESDLKGPKSSWPILMFLGVILGAPWLIWRLIASVTNTKLSEKWVSGEGAHYLAVALYDYQGDGQKELAFRAGQEIILAPRSLQPRVRGWLMGSVDKKTTGLVPANYVRIQSVQQGSASSPVCPPESPQQQQPAEMSDMSSTLCSDIPPQPQEPEAPPV